MPHLWNDKLVVTTEELAPWYNYEAIKKRLQRYADKPYGMKKVWSGGNGRKLFIDFDTLDEHIKQALGDPRKVNHILERFYKIDGEAVTFYTKEFQFEDGTYLDLESQDQYILNASVLKSILGLRDARTNERLSKNGSVHANGRGYGMVKVGNVDETLCADAASFNECLRVKHGVTHTLPASNRRFKPLLKTFETLVNGRYNYAGIIKKTYGNNNARKVTDVTLDLLQSMFAKQQHKPTPTEIAHTYAAFIDGKIEVINVENGEVYNPADFKKLSKSTVKKYLKEWKSRIASYALRSGDRQTYMQQFKTYHSLKKPEFAGSIISVDDRQPPFKTLDGKRVWFYLGVDLATGAITTWVFGENKEGIITEFYRQMVRNYAEWGLCLPYELEAEMSLNSSFVNTFLKPGAMFAEVRLEANSARSKKIERYNKEFRYTIEKKQTGWVARPFAKSEPNQAGPNAPKALHYDEIIKTVLRGIQTWNNIIVDKTTGLSRWEQFKQKQHAKLLPINYRGILPYIGRKTPTSCNVGIIHLNYGEYLLGHDGKVALGESLITLMKQVEGKNIDVWWLDGNDGKVIKALVYVGDQYICEAVSKPVYNRAKLEQTEVDAAMRSVMSAYVATITAFGKRQTQSIDDVIIIDNQPQPKQVFVIPGLEERKPASGEIMPEITEEDEFDNLSSNSFKSSLIDRF